jgi:hypothetical protein
LLIFTVATSNAGGEAACPCKRNVAMAIRPPTLPKRFIAFIIDQASLAELAACLTTLSFQHRGRNRCAKIEM